MFVLATTFSELAPGDYAYEVRHVNTGSPLGDTFWGTRKATVTAGNAAQDEFYLYQSFLATDVSVYGTAGYQAGKRGRAPLR